MLLSGISNLDLDMNQVIILKLLSEFSYFKCYKFYLYPEKKKFYRLLYFLFAIIVFDSNLSVVLFDDNKSKRILC